jgi:hypothetical protein
MTRSSVQPAVDVSIAALSAAIAAARRLKAHP